jgi:hypothetical protein
VAQVPSRVPRGSRPRASTDTDKKALALRREGRGYRSIARELGLGTVRHAVEAFNRGLRLQPERARQKIRREESARLDALWERTKDNADLTPADLERRRRGVAWHRAQLEAP